MSMMQLKVQDATTVAGNVVKQSLFGVNLLFDRDRDATDPSGQTISANYAKAVTELGAGNFRYPGGTIAETMFDFANAFSTQYPGGQSLANAGAGASAHLSLIGALNYADQMNLSMTFVMPTYRFLGTNADASGHRPAVVDQKLVHDFVTRLLEEASKRGVTIEAIELGNEWSVDNSGTFGTRMTPVEYGRIASSLAAVTQAAIDAFMAKNGLSAAWDQPDIVVQVGPGGKAERFSADGHYIPDGFKGATAPATEFIFREFNTDAEQSAIDGLVTHRYLVNSAANLTGWPYSPFDAFDALAAKDKSFGSLDRYVTEWNVAARNADELGLKQAGSLIGMLVEMVEAEVDHANIWAVQQNNGNRLTNNAGFAGEAYKGLSIAGETFRMLQDATVGLTYVPIVNSSHATVNAFGFGSADVMVVYLVNTSGVSQSLSLNPSQIAVDYHHVWGSTLGIAGEDFTDPRATPQIEFSNATALTRAGGISVALDPYEVIQLTFTLGDIGVSMKGDTVNNKMVGTDFADTLDGGLGSDMLLGAMGNDQLTGGDGSDTVLGGGGMDTLMGDAGADELDGGNANDCIHGGSGIDRLLGGAGNDQLFGGDGDDRIFGGIGADNLQGGLGADVFVFAKGDGKDVIVDFTDGVDKIQLTGLGFLSDSDALGYARQLGADVQFRLPGGDTLLILQTTMAALEGDFLF